MDTITRRSFYVLGTSLFWIGLADLGYQFAIVRDFSPPGLIHGLPAAVLIIAGSVLQGNFFEAVLLLLIVLSISSLSIVESIVPFAPLIGATILLIDRWYDRFEKWRDERRNAIEPPMEGEQHGAEAKR